MERNWHLRYGWLHSKPAALAPALGGPVRIRARKAAKRGRTAATFPEEQVVMCAGRLLYATDRARAPPPPAERFVLNIRYPPCHVVSV